MALVWRLRQVMASRGIWSEAELGRLMERRLATTVRRPSAPCLQKRPGKSRPRRWMRCAPHLRVHRPTCGLILRL